MKTVTFTLTLLSALLMGGGLMSAPDLPDDTGTPAKPAPAAPPSTNDRLDRLEQQMAAMLEEMRALRQEMKGGGYRPKGAAGSGAVGNGGVPSADPAMQPGVLVKSYVRTGQADAASPPPPKATPSDERINNSASFHPVAASKAAGYTHDTTVTVVWEGFYKVEEADNFEFIIQSSHFRLSGILQVDSHIITTGKGGNSVRLKMDKGYWPIKLTAPAIYNGPLDIRVKRSGLDPVPLTPGDLWTRKIGE